MKRLLYIAIAALALAVPAIASAQGVTLVYRPELRGFVAVPTVPAPSVAAQREPAAPADVIARHEAMATGPRINPRHAATGSAHCDRHIASARDTHKH